MYSGNFVLKWIDFICAKLKIGFKTFKKIISKKPLKVKLNIF